MESIKVCNGTEYKILVSLFNVKETNPIESSWIEPINSNRQRKMWTSKSCPSGIYRIHTEIIDEGNGFKYETSVRVTHPVAGIILEADETGIFWWKVNKESQ